MSEETPAPPPGSRQRRTVLVAVAILFAAVLAWWCLRPEPEPSYVRIPFPGTNATAGYVASAIFKTGYTNEASMCVSEILEDVAEMALRAASGRAPEPGAAQVSVEETEDSRSRHPRYLVRVALGQRSAEFPLAVDVLWDAGTYRDACRRILQLAGVTVPAVAPVSPPSDAEGPAMMGRLLDAQAVTLARESRRVSEALSKDFLDVRAHEQAAFLHGVLVLKERSGFFYDTRLGLCRLVAHLSLARALGGGSTGVAGDAAEAIALVGMRRQAEVVDRLGDPAAEPDPSVAAWLRILRTAATGDYRLLSDPATRTPFERVTWLHAYMVSVGVDHALEIWPYAQLRALPDARRVIRLAGPWGLSRELARDGLASEADEQRRVFLEYFGDAAGEAVPPDRLNMHPEHCFTTNGAVRVLGWGHWAAFFQRHLLGELCGRIDAAHYAGPWDPDVQAARALARSTYADLQLQPLLLRQTRTNWMDVTERFEQAVALGLSHPELVPSILWGRILPIHTDAPLRMTSQMQIAVQEWFRHYPLPGTGLVLYDARMDYGTHGKIDDESLLAELGRVAPYSLPIKNLRDPYRTLPAELSRDVTRPPPALMREIWEPCSGFMPAAMWEMARLSSERPDEYERWLLAMIRLAPVHNLQLGAYFQERNDIPKALHHYEEAFTTARNSPALAGWVETVVDLELKAGHTDKAAELALQITRSGDFQGLAAAARIAERGGRFREAFDLLERVDQEHGQSDPLIAFCVRHAPSRIGTPDEPLLFNTLARLRPKESRAVSLGDFQAPPAGREGVDVYGDDPLIAHFGFRPRDVVVAVNGWSVRNVEDLKRLMALHIGPQWRFIVWDWSRYGEVVCEDSDRMEGFPFGHISPRSPPEPKKQAVRARPVT